MVVLLTYLDLRFLMFSDIGLYFVVSEIKKGKRGLSLVENGSHINAAHSC